MNINGTMIFNGGTFFLEDSIRTLYVNSIDSSRPALFQTRPGTTLDGVPGIQAYTYSLVKAEGTSGLECSWRFRPRYGEGERGSVHEHNPTRTYDLPESDNRDSHDAVLHSGRWICVADFVFDTRYPCLHARRWVSQRRCASIRSQINRRKGHHPTWSLFLHAAHSDRATNCFRSDSVR